jgi:hypothetical protein
MGKVAEAAPQFRLRRTSGPIADHLAIGTDESRPDAPKGP